jgi:hypothetical protein
VTSLRKTIMEDNVKQNDVKMGWLAIWFKSGVAELCLRPFELW